MGCVGHVASVGFQWENLNRTDHLAYAGMDGKMMMMMMMMMIIIIIIIIIIIN
jgi:hypothetical protein